MHKKKLWWGKTGEYTPLKYIKSSGTQYIELPVQFYGDNYKIECKYDNTDTPSGTTPFGYQNTGSGVQIMIIGFNNENSTGSIFWNGTSTAHANRAKANVMTKGLNEIVIEAKNGTLTYSVNGGSPVSYETNTSFSPQTGKMWLFGNNRQSAGGSHQLVTMQFNYLRIYQNNEIKYNFISVLDKNGVPCVLETVNGTYHYNQGTGDFTYEQWDFTPCDYVYTDGNAYLNTLWYGDENTATEVYVKSDDLAYRIAVGSRSSATADNITSFVCDTVEGVVQDFGNYRTTRQTTSKITAGNYVRCYNSKDERWIEEDGQERITTTTQFAETFTTPTPIYLGYAGAGSYPSTCANFKGNYKEAKIYENGVLVRELIPVVDGDNKGCFYDKTLNALFYSLGASDFVGHFVENGVDYKVVKYLESTGTQYIDTGYTFTSLNHSNKYRFKNITGGSRTPYWVGGSQAPSGGETRSGGIARITSDATKVGVGIGGVAAGSATYRTDMPTTDFQTMEIISKETNKFDWVVDGVKIYSDIAFTGTSISGVNEYLFGVNALGGADFFGNSTQSSYQSKEDGKVVRNMIAVVNGTTAGMFDTVNRQFHGNDGTGTFNYEEV